jgi:CRISPR-associated endonuclease/helicase Cas3
VGGLTGEFAEALGAREAGYWLGLWHDVGKFDPVWQEYLLRSEASLPATRVDHKAAGTRLAAERGFGGLALLIQGHHGGLPNASELKAWLADRGAKPGVSQAIELARGALPDLEDCPFQPDIPKDIASNPWRAELFMRLLFAALIDADRLDTERHGSVAKAAIRGSDATMAELWARLVADQHRFDGATGTVNEARRAIYEACIRAADAPPGIFRLAVPTGGGKTRSGLAFALRHAVRNGQHRVIVAVPFISITQQTAAEYQKIFGAGTDERPIVLEHHSGVQRAAGDEEAFGPRAEWARLAAENWDAPLTVTTTVQLFESLFSNSTSATRKLHRLAGSVVILDEAQALPPHLLTPILSGLRELSARYGTTVVLSTATQPAFESIPIFADVPATSIVPDAERYFRALRRVAYDWRIDDSVDWGHVAEWMRDDAQALAIVNTKKDAIALLDALDDPEVLHLSTLLCGAHRRAVIDQVKDRLARQEPCRLVSTQVVEAGVDIDFPLVLRALGPLDSIIQAAGRCNREGRLAAPGRVVVFRPADGGSPASAAYKIGTSLSQTLVAAGYSDLDDPTVATMYFQRLFSQLNTDREGIEALRKLLDYPEVARRFRMIEDDTESVVITTYGTPRQQVLVRQALDELGRDPTQARFLLRRLQPYTVAIRREEVQRLRREGFISEPLADGVSEWFGGYDRVRGITASDAGAATWVV